MNQDQWPSLSEIEQVFTEEIRAAKGSITNWVRTGAALYQYALLDLTGEVKAGDKVQGGVGLWANASEIMALPYILRQVCVNGAVLPMAIGREVIRRRDNHPDPLPLLRTAIRYCAEPDNFHLAAERMRQAGQQRGSDFESVMHLLLGRLFRGQQFERQREIHQRFLQEGDSSLFGLVNAVTALARDTKDPGDRWRLQQLGGQLLYARQTQPAAHSTRFAAVIESFRWSQCQPTEATPLPVPPATSGCLEESSTLTRP